MVKKINESEAVKKIIDTLNFIHPMSIPRINMDIEDANKLPEVEIVIFLLEDDDIPHTSISILDGNRNCKSSVMEGCIYFERFIEEKSIENLINYLLIQYPIIQSFDVSTNSIFMNFIFSHDEFNLYQKTGLSANSISLNITTRDNKLNNEIRRYLEFILNAYYEKLSDTSLFKNEYNKWIENEKKNIIFQLSRDNMMNWLKLLTDEDLKNLFINMPNDVFLRIYSDVENSNLNKESAKRLIKVINK